MKWKGWWKPKTEDLPKAEAGEALSPGSGTEIRVAKPVTVSVIERSIRQFPHLGPPNTTVEAFVRWMQANGGTGKHLQGDLYDAYRLLCARSESLPMSDKRFGKEMERICGPRGTLDVRNGNKVRSKSREITIPNGSDPPNLEAKIARQLVDWESPKGPSRKRTARMKRAETKRKCVA